MAGVISLIIFLFIIGLLVLVHELGHMLAAKWAGVKVLEFAVGFGPTLMERTVGETTYKLRAIPLGGYVRLFGDRSERNLKSDDPTAYFNAPIYKKAIILLAGIFMNIVLAAILSAGYLHLSNYSAQLINSTEYSFSRQTEGYQVTAWVTGTVEGGAAEGILEPGDQILKISGAPVSTANEFVAQVKQRANSMLELEVLKADGLEPEMISIEIGEQLGVVFVTVYNLHYAPDLLSGVSYAFDLFGYQIKVLSSSVAQAISTRNADPVLQNTGSIVAVGVYVNDIVASSNLAELLQLTIAVSLALAFFNLLPIPVLDGGQLFLEVIESLTRKKIPESLDAWITLVSFVIVFGLGILLMLRDISQFRLIDELFMYLRSVVGR
jgi:regulator of sigma E protease